MLTSKVVCSDTFFDKKELIEWNINQSTLNDQHFISPYNIQTLSSMHVRRITKIINWLGDIVLMYQPIVRKRKTNVKRNV